MGFWMVLYQSHRKAEADRVARQKAEEAGVVLQFAPMDPIVGGAKTAHFMGDDGSFRPVSGGDDDVSGEE